MTDVVRWGRSAYETPEDLARERAAAEALGWTWSLHPDRAAPPDLSRTRVLVVTSGVRVTEAVLARFGGDLVLTTTSGHDHVDVEAARARGVLVGRTPEARRDAVVEHAVVGASWLARRWDALVGASRGGRWARAELPALAPRGLAGATVGVVGHGVIGRAAVRAFAALGARCLVVDPFATGVETSPLEDVLPRADVLTLHCALTPSSRGLVGSGALGRLPAHAIVVNTARGPVLDVEAAVARVVDGRLGGLVCDVFPEEPYPSLARGAAHPGVLFTPHSAGFTRDLGAKVAAGVAASLAAHARGEEVPHPVR